MSHDVRTVIDGMSFTECPRWHEDRLWFVDFYTHRVHSVTENGADLRTEAEVPQQPSGLGWLPDGRLLVVSQLDRRILRREADGSLETHADLSERRGRASSTTWSSTPRAAPGSATSASTSWTATP